jgi:hypothetical protein
LTALANHRRRSPSPPTSVSVVIGQFAASAPAWCCRIDAWNACPSRTIKSTFTGWLAPGWDAAC